MAIFMLDIVANFCTGKTGKELKATSPPCPTLTYRSHVTPGFHVDSNSLIEMRWGMVVRHYLSGWFILDILAALPREALQVPQNSSIKTLRVAVVGLHALKYAKIGTFARRLHIHMDIQVSPFTFNMMCWTGLLFTWVHYTACINAWLWLAVDNTEYLQIDMDGKAYFQFDEDICGLQPNKGECIARYYLRAFRTAVGFMIGHGQFTGNTWREEIMIVVCSFSGKVLYQSFMSYCIHLMMRISRHRTIHYQKNQVLDKYLGRREVEVLGCV